MARTFESASARLAQVLETLREDVDVLLVDAPPGDLVWSAAAGDLILLAGPGAHAMTESYRLIKRLNVDGGRRRMHILANRMQSASHADKIFGNLSATSKRFLNLPLEFLGCIPDDERMLRAARLRQMVVEAFPESDCARSRARVCRCRATLELHGRRWLRGFRNQAGRQRAYAYLDRPLMWRRTVTAPTLTADQNKLVTQMAPLVKRIAYHFMARLPASVSVDDLIQAGLLGLLDAAKNFDDTQGAQFETYAIQRIRGSMLDELRQADWLPRNVRKNLRRIEASITALEQKLGRPPREQELAEALGVPLDEYQTMLLESRGYQLLHYEDFQESEDSDFFDVYMSANQTAPLDVLEDNHFRQHLVQAISGLPEREKIVMGLYYEQEMNLKEIGTVLGVSESRVCQLHGQAVMRLRGRLKEWTRKS